MEIPVKYRLGKTMEVSGTAVKYHSTEYMEIPVKYRPRKTMEVSGTAVKYPSTEHVEILFILYAVNDLRGSRALLGGYS